jgi:hypothetical protein
VRDYGGLSLYVSPLGGVDSVQVNLATVSALRVWRSLRRPTPADPPEALQHAVVYWPADQQPVVQSAEAAERQISPLVLWGTAQRYGDGYLVDAYLSAPFASDARVRNFNQVWSVAVNGQSVGLGLPREVFSLGAAEIPDELVALYNSPSALRVCPTKVRVCQGPAVGGGMIAGIQEPQWAQVVTSSHVKGWIYLPGLSTEADSVEYFASGILAYYRGEFSYAGRLFDKVAANEASPDALRADARALSVCARSRVDPVAAEAAADGLAAAPASAYDIRVSIMNTLALAARAKDAAGRQAALARAKADLIKHAGLFEPDDPWFVQVRKALGVSR